MKILLSLFILILAVNSFAENNDEFRATWVITWNHSSSSDDVETSKARIRKILDNHKKANMNAVLWQVRQGGTAYYNSSYEPWGPYSNGPYQGGYDLFAYAVEQAHARGMEIHAWFNVFSASNTSAGTPAAEHPEWICRDNEGHPMESSRALSPGLKVVRDYTINVAMEVVRNYDIDGLHLDYVRWNEYSSSSKTGAASGLTEKEQQLDGFFSEEQIQALGKTASGRYLYDVNHPYSAGVPEGFASWEDWWRWSVTEFVRSLHDSIQAVKPWVRLSPAALGKYRWSSWQGYGSVFQDAALWFNEGYVDQLTPMHYHWTTGDGFYGMLTADGDQSWGYYIQKGISAGRLFSVGPGSYILDDQNKWDNHKEIVDRSRTIPWVDGFQFFSYGDWAANVYWEEAKELFFTNKTKIRAASFLNSDIPDSPTLAVSKIDSFHYQLDITPPAGLSDNQWFAVYRSEDDTADVSKDEIIEIKFGASPFSVLENFDGFQDFNGRYTYFATTLNRFWNESPVSNIQISDSLTSFAPVVASTYPVIGDSLGLFDDLTIHFSKTMNPSTFENNVTVNNGVEIEKLTWSDKNKSVTLSFVGSLLFDTEYTLTISADVEDVNGKKLDGNGDGGSSEPFIYQFHTYAEDNRSPEISFSNLNLSDTTKSVDTKEVLTFVFNELLDANTIASENVKIFRGANEVPSKYKLNTFDYMSVLSIQPEEPFGSFVPYSVVLGQAITDTAGNELSDDINTVLRTEPFMYSDELIIDEMYSDASNWWDPEGSGSTVGTIGGNTKFSYTNGYYLPSTAKPYKKYSAHLQYEWDPDESTFLLREYCAGSPRSVTFDTSYTLQVYLYGDNSGNKFRFSLSEKNGQGYPLEVSKWVTIDWIGWKLIEWKLSDPTMVGAWLGNEILDGDNYTIDSYQLTHPDGADMTGNVYFSNLRAIKKTHFITGINETTTQPTAFALEQNYPNPFNPLTEISFSLSQSGQTQLSVYNLLGQKVRTLINKSLPAGAYHFKFDASSLASGTYVYELRSKNKVLRKKMVLVK